MSNESMDNTIAAHDLLRTHCTVLAIGLVVLAASSAVAQGVFIDKGACPGEGCTYGERWVARSVVELLKAPDSTTPIIATVKSGEAVRTVTGEVHTIPGRFVVYRRHEEFQPGDEVLVYTYLGEGVFRIRHNGQLKETDLDFGPGGGSSGKRCEVQARCWGTLQEELQFTWWVLVRTPAGTEGWVRDTAGFLRPRAQAPEQPSAPRFEVASVKLNTSNDGVVAIQTQKGRFIARGFTLAALIRNAYGVQEFQIVGGPDWINTERFDVEATFSDDPAAPGGRSRTDLMLRALLAERFTLAVHNETRDRPVFALVFARTDKKPGPELQKSATDCATAKGPDACSSSVGPGFMRLRGRTMAQFAGSLSQLTITGSSLNRMIVDRTGLEGPYNLTLRFTPDNVPPVSVPGFPPVDPNGPSIFTAMQEQLGLKLESSTGMVDVVVVDSAARPTPN